MTDIEKLILASNQVDSLVNLFEDNPYKSYLYQHLNPIKYEIQRQLVNLNVTDPNENKRIHP